MRTRSSTPNVAAEEFAPSEKIGRRLAGRAPRDEGREAAGKLRLDRLLLARPDLHLREPEERAEQPGRLAPRSGDRGAGEGVAPLRHQVAYVRHGGILWLWARGRPVSVAVEPKRRFTLNFQS